VRNAFRRALAVHNYLIGHHWCVAVTSSASPRVVTRLAYLRARGGVTLLWPRFVGMGLAPRGGCVVDRRSFLRTSLVLPAALIAPPAHSALFEWPSSVGVSLALVDRGLEGSEALTARAGARGLRALSFAGDVAGLWMSELEPCFRSGPTVIEGYTSPATLFCLDLLARDYGARTVRRHDVGSAVAWVLSSSPPRRAPLAPLSRWSSLDA
jgi:hypothetical protein